MYINVKGNAWDSFHRGKLNFVNNRDHQIPSFPLLMLISWEINMTPALDSHKTTFKLAKGPAASTDPANLPDQIPAGGIPEVRQSYMTDNILAFDDQSPVIPSLFSFMDTMINLYLSRTVYWRCRNNMARVTCYYDWRVQHNAAGIHKFQFPYY